MRAVLLKRILGYRKAAVAVLVVAVASAFRASDLLTGKEFVEIVDTVVWAFMGTNTAEHGLKVLRSRRDTEDSRRPSGGSARRSGSSSRLGPSQRVSPE